MLNARVTVPTSLAAQIVRRLQGEPTVSGIVHIPGVALRGEGDLVEFEMARENADAVMRMLHRAGLAQSGSISVSEPLALASDAATAAERAAPGHPADGVLWAQLGDRSREDARPSWSFFVFLLLATLIAGIGRLLDQPILIIGAMVVGPEFAPVAAICYAVVRRERRIIGGATLNLLGGFAVCALIAWGVWAVAYAFGAFTFEQATTGTLTQFIISPDSWSFVIALLAGVAGVLSLTTSKSSALVGVFISITTVPAVGAIGLTLAVGAWDEAASAAIQLAINLLGLLIAGVATLWIQLHAGRWVARLRLPTRRASGRIIRR